MGRQKVNDPLLNSSGPPLVLKNECSLTRVNPMISIESEEFGTNMTAGVLFGMKHLEIHGKWW